MKQKRGYLIQRKNSLRALLRLDLLTLSANIAFASRRNIKFMRKNPLVEHVKAQHCSMLSESPTAVVALLTNGHRIKTG